MARSIQLAYAASVQALWAAAEASLTHSASPLTASLAWAAAWFTGYSIGVRQAAAARGRRRLTLASGLLAVGGYLLLAMGGHPLVSYSILTLSLSLAVSAAVAAIVNEDDYATWRGSIASAKATVALASLAFLTAASHLGMEGLAAASVTLAAVAAPSFWDPIIPPAKLRLLDRFAEEAALLRPRPAMAWRDIVWRLAILAGLLAVARVTLLSASSHQLAGMVHAAGLAAGSLAAARHERPGPGLAGLAGLAGAAAALLGLDPLGLALVSLGHGYADTALLVVALEHTPTGAPRYTLSALAWMMAGALSIAILNTLGVSVEEAAAAIAAVVFAASLRGRPRWD